MNKIINAIKKNKTFLITAHVNLEGDALGAELAMRELLRCLGKKADIINNDITPANYHFMPGIKSIRHKLPAKKYDAVMFLDCSDFSRAGNMQALKDHASEIINVDHHVSNTFFGNTNWVVPDASSTCEQIYLLSRKLGVMNKTIAVSLYVGMVTDTGGFIYPNTTAQTYKAVADIIKFGVRPDVIFGHLNSLCVLDDIKYMSKIMASIKLTKNKKVSWVSVPDWKNMDYDLPEKIFSFMRLLKDVEVFVLFKEIKKGVIRVNFRSRLKFNVNKTASFFGGGGHKNASGALIEGKLSDVESNVIRFIDSQFV
ncbi:MAG: bifunctional oligoribonuclease/PAP phosphatase NrnA [Candidatus Omnitrophica bacterium]|jgi:phosphoesterase RecJ-like protein|nr:bifunctional oligoribonuclease/PAP phosphatase NrnA [Candidatus Omnitrophota bacterium]MDD5080509.1 bifunctional oligoribonuclease/PAP phosphatase NrnA [Candidatus Omnitrophota bacterium]